MLKLKCTICGEDLDLSIGKHYVARDDMRSGLAVALSNDEAKLFDAFDCPHCGCQFVAQERKRPFVPVAEEDAEADYEKPKCLGHFDEECECDECCDYYKECVEQTGKKQPPKKFGKDGK